MQNSGRHCVVLGGGGFLGINLCLRLRASGCHVRAFGHRGLFPSALKGIDFVPGDFSDRAALSAALDGSEIAFHLVHSTVPHTSNLDVVADVRDNLLPSLTFLDLAREAGIRRVVFVSSGGTVYGSSTQIPTNEEAPTNPITAYGITKLAIEKYLALYRFHYGLDYRILRVANPFGPFQVQSKRQGLIAEIISKAIDSEPIEVWGDGSVVRDFIFVDDVIDAIELAAEHNGVEQLFNIGSGAGHSVNDVLKAVENSLGQKLSVVRKGARKIDVPVSVLSIQRACEKLGWTPKSSFEDGIAQTITWWKHNADSIRQSMPSSGSASDNR